MTRRRAGRTAPADAADHRSRPSGQPGRLGSWPHHASGAEARHPHQGRRAPVTHVAFLVPPLSGHISPTLGVVAALTARGHQVSYAVTDEYAQRVSDAGARRVGYLTTLRPAGDAPAGAPSFG